MARKGAPLDVVRFNVLKFKEDEFNSWYHQTSMPGFQAEVPGVIDARRYVAETGDPRYHLTFYEFPNTEVLEAATKARIERKQALEEWYGWFPYVRDFFSGYYEQIFFAGKESEGPGKRPIFFVRFTLSKSREAEFNTWFETRNVPHFLETVPHVVNVRRYRALDGDPRFYLTVYEYENEETLDEAKQARMTSDREEDREQWRFWLRYVRSFTSGFYRQIYPE